MSFYQKEYKKLAKEILNESIKTALFIDENALEPFSKKNKNDQTDIKQTEKLSEYLYKHFNSNKISLTIHKFKNIDSTKPFLNKKDIILLDWHLDGITSGEEYALELLDEITKKSNINFCCIYTNSPKEAVINNCISYFSGYTRSFYESVYEEYSLDEDLVLKLTPFLEKILTLSDPNNPNDLIKISNELKQIKGLAKQISEIEPLKSIHPFTEKIRILAYSSKEKLKKTNNVDTFKIDFLDKKNFVFTINSTLVVILNKDHEHDKETLFKKIQNEIISKHNSYLVILGLEMKNHLNSNHSFITGDVLNIKNETIAFHWNQNLRNGNEVLYQDFIKQLMADQTDTIVKENSFKILDTNILNVNKIKSNQDLKQLSLINAFYNGTFKNEDNRLVNFGDIFQNQDNKEEFYLCITALCDCLHPKKIENNYYFVKGKKFSINTAINLGDEAFISYIDDEICVIWPNFGINTHYDRFKPIYIKPLQFHLPKSKIVNFKIISMILSNGEKKLFNWEYKFTLRNQYTQRIANHAFSYPLRVGIDFVKKM